MEARRWPIGLVERKNRLKIEEEKVPKSAAKMDKIIYE